MIVAKDLMTPSPQFIYSSEDIHVALKKFHDAKFGAIPVISPSKEILGILSEFSVIRIIVNLKSDPPKVGTPLYNYRKLFEKSIQIKEWTTLEDILRELIKAPYHRALVVDATDKILGIISPKDVISILLNEPLNKNKSTT